MKYLPLIWAGISRSSTRSLLTALTIVIAFVLFGILQGINQGMSAAIERLHLDRLYVMSRVNATWPQPVTSVYQVRKVPGVTRVAHWSYFAGYFRDKRNGIGGFAIDTAELFALYPEIKVSKEQVAAMLRQPTGIIISKSLADELGWKVGDRVPVGSYLWTRKNGESVWYFDVVGIYEPDARASMGDSSFYVNFSYFDEDRAQGTGLVHMIVAGIHDPTKAVQIARTIDSMFINSGSQTRTRNEQVYARNQMKQVGEVSLIANAIVGAAFFALLFVTANTMMQSVRERIPEIGVLKTIGFSGRGILLLLFLEALVICLTAALLGLGIAGVIYPKVSAIFGSVEMPVSVIVMGVAMAAVVAIVSTVVPGFRAMRIHVVDALAGR